MEKRSFLDLILKTCFLKIKVYLGSHPQDMFPKNSGLLWTLSSRLILQDASLGQLACKSHSRTIVSNGPQGKGSTVLKWRWVAFLVVPERHFVGWPHKWPPLWTVLLIGSMHGSRSGSFLRLVSFRFVLSRGKRVPNLPLRWQREGLSRRSRRGPTIPQELVSSYLVLRAGDSRLGLVVYVLHLRPRWK